MKNKKGNVAVIALIVVIVAITTGVITWLVATKSQAPVQQVAKTQSVENQQTTPVAQTQLVTQPSQSQEQKNVALYQNTDFGFKIQLPQDFGDYKTKIFPIDTDTTRISFFLPTTDKTFRETNAFPEKEFMLGYSEFFSIDAMTISGWNKFLADCKSGKQEMGCITDADLIGKNKQFTFQAGISGTPSKDVSKRVENKITFEYLGKNFSILP